MNEELINPGLLVTRNGDRAVQLTTAGTLRKIHSGLQDLSTVNQTFDFDQDRIHLGMLYTFDALGTRMNRSNQVPSILLRMLRNRAVINLEDGQNSFTYSTPVNRYSCLKIVRTTEASECSERPGLGKSEFPIYLNRSMRKGDILTYDIEDGIQIVVTEDRDIEPQGDMFKHWVKVSNGGDEMYMPLDKLVAGTQYTKISHTMGEMSEEYSEFWFDVQAEELVQEFALGNHLGVSTKTTLYGGERATSGFTAGTKAMLDKVIADVNIFKTSTSEPYDSLIMLNNYVEGETYSPQGLSIDTTQDTVMSLFEAMAVSELIRLEVSNMLWAKEAFIIEINGHKRVNEGLYHQFKRGHVFSYAIPGGVDVPFLQRLMDAIFIHNVDMPTEERRAHITAGKGLAENLDWIIQNLGLSKLNQPEYRTLLGNSSVLPESPVKGPLNALRLQEIKFREVFIPGAGWLTYEHDPSLDYSAGQDRNSNKVTYQGGRNRGTYSGYIDVRDSNATNVFSDPNLRRASFMDQSSEFPTSVFYVKPRRSLHWGWENGRMNSVSNLINELSHLSSVKAMTTEFWMHVRSAAWIGDKSSIFFIELERPCLTTI